MMRRPLLRCMRALSGMTRPWRPHLPRECARWRVHRLPMGALLRHAWMRVHELLLRWEAWAWMVARHGSGIGVGVGPRSSLGVRGVILGRLLHGVRLRHGLVGALGLGWGVLGAWVGGVEGLGEVWGVLGVRLRVLSSRGVLQLRLGVRLGVAGVLCGAMRLVLRLVVVGLMMGLTLGLWLWLWPLTCSRAACRGWRGIWVWFGSCVGGLTRSLGPLSLLLGLLRVVGVGGRLGGVLALGVRPGLLGRGVALVGGGLLWLVLGALLGLGLGVAGLGGILGAILRGCLASLGSAVLLLRWRVLVGRRPLLGLGLLLLVLGLCLRQRDAVRHLWSMHSSGSGAKRRCCSTTTVPWEPCEPMRGSTQPVSRTAGIKAFRAARLHSDRRIGAGHLEHSLPIPSLWLGRVILLQVNPRAAHRGGWVRAATLRSCKSLAPYETWNSHSDA